MRGRRASERLQLPPVFDFANARAPLIESLELSPDYLACAEPALRRRQHQHRFRALEYWQKEAEPPHNSVPVVRGAPTGTRPDNPSTRIREARAKLAFPL